MLVLSTAMLLTACGGGSDSKNTDVEQIIPPNTAPTLSGFLTLTAPAKNTANLVIIASDAEGDNLSATIIDAPDWLTMTF